MKKLELNHLAPYLPYGLKYESDDYGNIRMMDMSTDIGKFKRGLYKPILRPLSDLTKEIEHNGENFVPNDKLHELTGIDELWMYISGTHAIFMKIDVANLIYNKLLEWHINVFDIPEHLYIDKSTLKDNEKP